MGRKLPTIKITVADALSTVINGVSNYLKDADYQLVTYMAFLTGHHKYLELLPSELQSKVCVFIAKDMVALSQYASYTPQEIEDGLCIVETGRVTEYDKDFIQICNTMATWNCLVKELKSYIGNYYVKVEEIFDRCMAN